MALMGGRDHLALACEEDILRSESPMPPPLPDRYRLEVRLGRNKGIEEWLATDTVLDRPVQIRVMGPEAPPSLREDYLTALRRSTSAFHPHLLSVYDAGSVPGGVFSAYEWTGGTALSNRQEAGAKPDPIQFQMNAAGLAGALATLHEAGVVHGNIDADAIYYSVDHPAKLGGLGPSHRDSSFAADVAQLVNTLEHWAIGGPSRGLPLSELVDGVAPTTDQIFAQGGRGELTASQLAALLLSVPDPAPPALRKRGASRSALWTAAGLTLAAIGLVGLGTVVSSGSDASPQTLPSITSTAALPRPSTTIAPAPTVAPAPTPPVPTVAPVLTAPPLQLLSAPDVATFDPYGGGGEMDHRLDRLVDGDRETTWRTERYYDPLSLIKAGVGLMMVPPPGARRLELLGITPGTVYTLAWADDPDASLRDWEPVAAGQITSGAFFLTLPSRPAGAWLLWFTELPYVGPENYSTSIAEVRFWG